MFLPQGIVERILFQFAESCLTDRVENLADAFLFRASDFIIQVNKGPAKALRKARSYGTFARTHESCQNDAFGRGNLIGSGL